MRSILILITLLVFGSAQAQQPIEIDVWPHGAPENNEISTPETIIHDGILSHSQEAKLFVYLPPRNGVETAAVLICPGGGYCNLSMEHEGRLYAKWLASQGIAAIVLKYRMPNGHYNIPLADAEEAMKIIRRKAKKWHIAPDKIGVSGFSAGGHLASTLGTKSNKKTRPNFMILFYPVITMKASNTHIGSRDNLLGKAVDSEKLIDHFSNEKSVGNDTPPTLLFLSDDDTVVDPSNSFNFYFQLKQNGISAALYIYPEGGHGWGIRDDFPYKSSWQTLLMQWLKQEKLI